MRKEVALLLPLPFPAYPFLRVWRSAGGRSIGDQKEACRKTAQGYDEIGLTPFPSSSDLAYRSFRTVDAALIPVSIEVSLDTRPPPRMRPWTC